MLPTMAFLPLHQTPAALHQLPSPYAHYAYAHHRLSLNSPLSPSQTSATTAAVAVLPVLPPSYMDAGPNSNPTSGASPTNSNTSNMSATVVNAAPSAPRKKQGRGPGKKDIKDKPTVSVRCAPPLPPSASRPFYSPPPFLARRWDDGDLTDRLIAAIETNDRWQGVFAPSSNEPGQVRSSAPVAKRDLQREIARHLFHSDVRYDLEDRKVLESLAVR